MKGHDVMTIGEYFGEWMKVIDIDELYKVVNQVNKIPRHLLCPEYSNIFRAFHLCPYNNLKIVMVGQDPYPQKGVATGILFGNKKEMEELSPSLMVVKESVINFEIPHNGIIFDQTLESWARQGILMINSALTCEVNKAGSHAMMWRPFISKLIKGISSFNTGIIYILFGEQAKTLKPYINKNWNYIFEEKHPAYYARQEIRMPSRVFTEASRIVMGQYEEPITWFEELK